MKITVYQVIMIIVGCLCLGLFFGGCVETPESFHASECKKTDGDLYIYACETPGYSRCLTPDGFVKYKGCAVYGDICVKSCSEVD